MNTSSHLSRNFLELNAMTIIFLIMHFKNPSDSILVGKKRRKKGKEKRRNKKNIS